MSDASTSRDQSERRPHEEQGEEQEQQQLLLPHNTAAHALAMETIALVNQGDTAYTLDLQAQIYKCLDATQQTLHSFNNYSEDLYRRYQRDMETHTRTMKEMKRDLEYIFKKTRMLKDRLDSSHPIPEED
ncbi:KxDL motif-containing protein 1 [Balamuthia mandrillaris]